MNESDIRKYASLMKELGLTAFEITEGTMKIRLESASPLPVSHTDNQSVIKLMETDEKAEVSSLDTVIKSPLVGVFYAAPAENAEPFVAPGKNVKKRDVLCIIEAMKLMNEVAASEDGVITEVIARNGQMVEFGTELFRIRRDR